MTQESASYREPLFLAARHLHATFTDQRIQALVGAGEQAVASCLLQHTHAVFIGGRWIDEQQVLSNASGEKLRVLSDEPDAFAQTLEIDVIDGESVVSDVACLRP